MATDTRPDNVPKYCPACKHLLHQFPAQPYRPCSECGCVGATAVAMAQATLEARR